MHTSVVFQIKRINVHCDVLSWLFFISLGNTKNCICQKEIFSHLQVRLVLIRLLFRTSGSLMVWSPSALSKDNSALLSLAAAGQEEERVLFILPNRPWWRLHPLPSRSRRTVYILWLPHVTHLRVESLFLNALNVSFKLRWSAAVHIFLAGGDHLRWW